MKVREEPVTPCTIEILPASRLESCAKEQRRPQVAHQPLVEEGGRVFRLRHSR